VNVLKQDCFVYILLFIWELRQELANWSLELFGGDVKVDLVFSCAVGARKHNIHVALRKAGLELRK